MLGGKLVVITGASRGIGAAAAREFAAAGARVALVARSAAPLRALADQIGEAALALPCDVADHAALSDAIAQAEQRFGPVAVLINNAGVIEPIARIEDVEPAAWSTAIDITLKGVFNGMRAVLPGMIARGGGTIVTVGSGAAHAPLEGWSAYCAGKAGAWMLTRAAHLEAGPAGVRVLSLSPGTVATDMQRAIRSSGVNPVSRLDWDSHVPPEWPARTLVWMCGPEADDFLGQEVSLREEGLRRRVGLVA
jgi:NAD(P)-dependent dehydrogenase (short-subunit alcohol dehydrogenase family)